MVVAGGEVCCGLFLGWTVHLQLRRVTDVLYVTTRLSAQWKGQGRFVIQEGISCSKSRTVAAISGTFQGFLSCNNSLLGREGETGLGATVKLADDHGSNLSSNRVVGLRRLVTQACTATV